ncbi:hypothetical protein CTAYLR_007741 [Chrysophaeum taylorii]|uniref:FYVE-type domain-containing protein n=1 Tax=Chrysophaeum taylorii TaxID=2483200 RepID=A0AAD7UM58_9STRA|nr:hypothetical protein CTAYLR_007741 [Chrysophaeum taylorii]
MILCPCLFGSSKEDRLLSTSLLRGGVSHAERRGQWLSEQDELASNCHACGVEFTLLEGRHHCRRCGNTFCQRCSSRRAQLLLYGGSDLERVCDECFRLTGVENELASRHLPLLERGATVALRTLMSKEMVLLKLNAAGDALQILAGAPHPRHVVPLAKISAVEVNGATGFALRGPETLRFDSDNRDAIASAVRATISHAQTPSLALTVDRQRKNKKVEQQRADAIREHQEATRARRNANADFRNSLKQKYALRGHTTT